MTPNFQIAGYNKQTERLSVTHRVPPSLEATARELARVDPMDDGEGAYPLAPNAAVALGAQMGKKLNAESYDWFLEPSQND